jgi:hypothetical protein
VVPLTEHKERKQEAQPGPTGEVCRDLICKDEWEDPASRKVITEYHKEGLPKEPVGVDADLEKFENYWKRKGGSIQVKGEYHKNGAPFVDRDIGWDTVNMQESSAAITEPKLPRGGEVSDQLKAEHDHQHTDDSKSRVGEDSDLQKAIQRPIDMDLIEMVSYAFFRVAFRNGVSIPIKRAGMVDMDVTLKGKEITINTNQLYFSVPELNVWHVVYQHRGKPIIELGRGVKKGMKVHRLQALRLGFEMWNGSRKMNKMRLKQSKEADKKAHAGSKNG